MTKLESALVSAVLALIGPFGIDTIRLTDAEAMRLEQARRMLSDLLEDA